MSDDLIGGPKVTAQLIITQLEDGTINVNGNADEMACRALLSKAAAILEDTWRVQAAQRAAQQAPRVLPANGLPRPRLRG